MGNYKQNLIAVGEVMICQLRALQLDYIYFLPLTFAHPFSLSTATHRVIPHVRTIAINNNRFKVAPQFAIISPKAVQSQYAIMKRESGKIIGELFRIPRLS